MWGKINYSNTTKKGRENKNKWENSQAKVQNFIEIESNRKQNKIKNPFPAINFALWCKSWGCSSFQINISCVQTLLVLPGGTSLCSPWTEGAVS